MRKVTLLVAALALLALAGPAFAVSFWSEQFSYADGSLVSNSGGNWTRHSGSTTPAFDIQVASGVAVGLMSNTPDDNRTFPAQPNTAKTYACFRAMVPTQAAGMVTNYFAHFKDSGTSNFAARVYVMPSGNTFTFGLSLGSCDGTACTPVAWPVALNFNQWYTIAIMYDPVAPQAKLWVDPAGEGSLSISHSTWSGTSSQAGFSLAGFALRQSTAGVPSGTSNWMYDVDNIQVGTVFGDLCPNPTPVKGSTWGRLKTLYR